MKSRIFSIALSVMALAAVTGASAAYAASFDRTLSTGMTGEDVRALQRILNSDPATVIAASGTGSKGQESAYFGALTRDAVIRFQEKHAREILFPNSLSAGTGIVGLSTRAVLNKIAEASSAAAAVAIASPAPSSPSAASPASSVASAVQTSPAAASSEPAQNQNPNAKNLGKVLAAIDRVNAKKGVPLDKTAAFKAAVTREMLGTTTDLREEFLNMVKNDSTADTSSMSPLAKAFYDAANYVAKLVTPPRAQAAVGSPFGGAVVASFYCACSDNWDVFIEPLPPTFVEELSYIPESQAFLSYNIPLTEWLLGQYTPGTGVCLEPGTPCEGGPTEGTISPMTGSSPL